jgi:hypothetical protein
MLVLYTFQTQSTYQCSSFPLRISQNPKNSLLGLIFPFIISRIITRINQATQVVKTAFRSRISNSTFSSHFRRSLHYSGLNRQLLEDHHQLRNQTARLTRRTPRSQNPSSRRYKNDAGSYFNDFKPTQALQAPSHEIS